MTNDKSLDFAIVGAGVSGVYSAWRIRKHLPDSTVAVFEAGDHVGGRLLSVRPPDIRDMVAELGGMRILPAAQPRIKNLIEVLNRELPPDRLIETYPFPVDQPQNIAYLRGSWLRLSDFTSCPDKIPYHLSFLDKGGTASTIILNAIAQIVPGVTNPQLNERQRRDMCQRARFGGKDLYKQGFWNVLSRVISGEAYMLGVDAGGYNTTLSNWNAADAIPWFLSDFGTHADYRGFTKGFQQVPLTLAELFCELGGDVRLNTPLTGFQFADEGVTLQFSNTTVTAKRLILAMPRRSLDLLAPTCPPLREISGLIASVTPRPLFKLFTTYDSPWWRAAGFYKSDGTFVPVEAGRTVTDLPVRQTYYWPRDDGSPADSGQSMLMASYDDGANIGFWDGLRPRRGQAWLSGTATARPEDPFVPATKLDPSDPWSRYEASAAMVEEVNRQLGTIHGLSYTPDVCHAAFRDWGDDPFGGGWNSWNIGVQSQFVKERMLQPIDGSPLYVCGEAYSDAQGWVEGALQTAELMLAKIGLDPL